MFEWNIHFVRGDIEDGTEESFIVLPSFLKVLWWFLRTARRCSQSVIDPTLHSVDPDPYEPFCPD